MQCSPSALFEVFASHSSADTHQQGNTLAGFAEALAYLFTQINDVASVSIPLLPLIELRLMAVSWTVIMVHRAQYCVRQ
jgi:hypothetical protein